jgi:ubiquinone/menaquinone biosynthesis C-methylase UbiE
MTTPDYDEFARAYSAENEANLINAYYERPEMRRLAGDVAGRRILDAGCGAGPLTAALRDAGAVVTGFDASAAMIDLARQRLGEYADLRVADLGDPLPFDDDQFDDVTASLVLHYLEEWTGPLAELRRVLKPGGRLLLSVNHPSAYAIVYPTLHAMADAFTAAGFRIASISEPPPAANTPPEVLPPGLDEGVSFMCFLFFVLEAA